MDRSANVTSIDAIRALRSALSKFEHGARDALTMLELEVRRGVDWIEQDRRRYWPAQAKQASNDLVEARTELERCELRFGSELAAPCTEQKKKYERAKQRLRYCEDQVRAVKKWTRTIQQELTEFDGQLAQLSQYLDADVPRALAALTSMLSALEKYSSHRQSVDVGSLEAPASPSSDTDAGAAQTQQPKGTADSQP